MDLTQCRQQIDEIDHELLRLFSERMNVVKQVANYKQQHQLPIFHPGRFYSKSGAVSRLISAHPRKIRYS